MHPDDHVCLCFRVSLRKIRAYVEREDPPVASLISECLGAGTGCRWCVPFLKKLHEQHQRGEPMQLGLAPDVYADSRASYRKTGQRPPTEPPEASDPSDAPRAPDAPPPDHAG